MYLWKKTGISIENKDEVGKIVTIRILGKGCEYRRKTAYKGSCKRFCSYGIEGLNELFHNI